MNRLKKIALSLPLTWLILAIPAWPFVKELWVNERYYAELMFETGILSIQMLVLVLIITPLRILLKRWQGLHPLFSFLAKRRRSFGIAAFAYSAFHTLFYLRHSDSWETILLESIELYFTFGWIAFIAMLIGALTSNQVSVRSMGLWWKPVQRLSYLAALGTVLHWWWVNQFLDDLIFWFAPLAALQVLRLGIRYVKNSRSLKITPQT